MISHVVLYQVYPRNSEAVGRIIQEARRLITPIPGIHTFHVAKVLATGRTVTSTEYSVLMNIIFKTKAAWEAYPIHPRHVEFAKFMLAGYMLEGTTASDRAAEFIEYILNGNATRSWVRDPAVPDRQVVWCGELVFDASSEDS